MNGRLVGRLLVLLVNHTYSIAFLLALRDRDRIA